MSRKFASWTDAFFEFTEKLPSPPLFRKWAAISLVAGALERKVWVKTFDLIFPNLYVVLVAPPGVGKTVLTKLVWELWSELEDHHLASSSVTSASLIDDLRDAERRLIMPDKVPSIVHFNSLLISSNELGVFMPGYESDFMSTLTDLYDCHPYSQRRRTKEIHFKLEAPQLNLLAATNPSYLNDLLPIGAWDQGFISRVILVFSGETQRRPLFDEAEADSKTFHALTTDLKTIGALYGRMTFTPEAANTISTWHLQKGPPEPDHPKLLHYNTRRTAHLLKLCMVASVATSDDLTITLDHYNQALDWLLEAEAYMPDAFKSMVVGGDSRAIEETWYHVYTLWMKEKKPIAEHRIILFLQERVPAYNVARILEVMKGSKLLEEKVEPKIGRCYVPLEKRTR